MDIVAEAFRAGGIWMYLILIATLVSWPVAILAVLSLLARKAKVAIAAGAIVAFAGLGTAGVGVVGYTVCLSEMEQAMKVAAPESRERLRRKGNEIALYPLYFGLGGGSLPLALGLLTLAVGVGWRGSEA